MSKKSFFETIDKVIDDWRNTSFTFYQKDYVPGLDPDSNLTYGDGENKKGIELNTCVLFVDIRNSVALTKEHQIRTMAKIYSVFSHCVLLAAQDEGGFVRNIIGDRVMIVFPPDGCYIKAVDCAITIYQSALRINDKFPNIDFKCGIGIDYGKLNVMKVGIQKKGEENDDNKGLVWIGYPANFASRLCDNANKTIIDEYYHVEGEGLTFSLRDCPAIQSPKKKVKEYSKEDLLNAIHLYDGALRLRTFARINSFEAKSHSFKFEPILMSKQVYDGFAKDDPNRKSIKEGYWKVQEHSIKDIDFVIYGGHVTWALT